MERYIFNYEARKRKGALAPFRNKKFNIGEIEDERNNLFCSKKL